MYSKNDTNQQQSGRQQAPNANPAPNGAKYVLHIEDVVTDDGRRGLAIYIETVSASNHETPAYCVAKVLNKVILDCTKDLGELMIDVLTRNQEG